MRYLWGIDYKINRKLGTTIKAPNQKGLKSKSAAEVDWVLLQAKRRFEEIDVEASGVLDGAELVGLVEWIWSIFKPGGKELTAEQRAEHGARLLNLLDANADGVMSFGEFADWFCETCNQLKTVSAVNGKTAKASRQKEDRAEALKSGLTHAELYKLYAHGTQQSTQQAAGADGDRSGVTLSRVRQLRKVFLCFDYNEDRLVEELEMLLVGRALHRGRGGWSAEQVRQQTLLSRRGERQR